MSETESCLKDFEPFFGGDKRGAFLVQAMYLGNDYTYSNRAEKSGLMIELLRAENYKDFQNVRSFTGNFPQRPDDIPQDITDLIINTALFHRSIDRPTSVGSVSMRLLNLVSDVYRLVLTTNIIALLQEIKDIESRVGTKTESIYEKYTDTKLDDIFPKHSEYKISTFAEVVIVNMLEVSAKYVKGKKEEKTAETTTEPEYEKVFIDKAISSTEKRSLHLENLTMFYDLINITNKMKSLYNKGNNKEVAKLLATASRKSETMSTIRSLLNKEIVVSTDDFIAAINNAVKKVLKDIFTQMNADFESNPPEGTEITDYASVGRIVKYRPMLIENLVPAIKEEIRKLYSGKSALYTTLSNPAARKFFDEVYRKWNNMTADVREFYYQNVAIFARSGDTTLYKPETKVEQELETTWRRLSEADIDALFAKGRTISDSEFQNLRVNLMKARPGLTEVLFASNLPDVPPGSDVWYTRADGNPERIPAPPADFLRKLYAAVYENVTHSEETTTSMEGGRYKMSGGYYKMYGGAKETIDAVISETGDRVQIVIDTDWDIRPKESLKLIVGKFISASIKREDERMIKKTEEEITPRVSGDLDYAFLTSYDMVYNLIWIFDAEKGLYYRMENGKRKYYNDEAKGDARTCYASYLARNDPKGCLRIMKCIADGNYESLNRCLAVLGDADLWDVAIDDVQKVGPDMIKLVLRKFHVRGHEETDSTGAKYVVPMPFDEWVRVVVQKDIKQPARDIILKNTKLTNYLKGLIAICRANPNIINKDVPSIIRRDTTPDYIKQLNMRKYKIPASCKENKYGFFADILRCSIQPQSITPDLFNPITSAKLYTNVNFFNPHTTIAPTLMGGFYNQKVLSSMYPAAINPALPSSGTSHDAMTKQAQYTSGSSNMFESLLKTINNAFNDVGLQLHPDDVNKLATTVEKLKTYENQLARMSMILINIVKIARFYGVSLENIDREHPKQMNLSELNTIDDITQFIIKYARDLRRNMTANMTIQQAIGYDLMHKVTPRMLDECYGRAAEPSETTKPEEKYVDF